jgi:hypothetical protein
MKNSIAKLVSLVNALIILFTAVACNYSKNKDLDNGLSSLVKVLNSSNIAQKEELKEVTKSLAKSQESNFTRIDRSERLEGVFDNSNTEKAVSWIKKNEAVINNVLVRMKAGIEKEITDINSFSKSAYLEKDEETRAFKYALIYYRLQYFKNNLSTVLENLSPLSMIIHSHALVDDQETLGFRKKLEKELLKMVGIGLVINQDIAKTKNTIKVIHDVNPLPAGLKKNLLGTDKELQENKRELAKKYKLNKEHCAEDNAHVGDCNKMEMNRQELMEEFKNVTFLYTPGSKYFLLTKILTIIGNLTWGLANTIIGAGIVLATMAVSPFTPYVDFPTFALSSSGMQIYVDVTGMSPLPGKMSMGLFELDNGTGYHFASEHEAGHAIQSAILGPLYLPTVLITYLISGFDQGLMEDLAETAAYASDSWL